MTTLSLRFDETIANVVRRRIGYAARVFAATYGYAVVDGHADLALCYAANATATRPGEHWIAARYLPRPPSEPAPVPRLVRRDGEDVAVFTPGEPPDFLGEIFEWLSAADERSIAARDEVGRIPYASTIFARAGLSPMRAHGTRMMSWLAAALHGEPGLRPPPPREHVVVCSHDIDFYFAGRVGAATRLAKNAAIATRTGNLRFLRATARQVIRLARGHRVGDYLPSLASAARTNDFESTAFVIAHSPHRRDANYALEHLVGKLDGFDVGLHGSYTSIVERRDLHDEATSVERVLRRRPRATRQHWLRFDQHEALYDAIERGGFEVDSTLGFRETCGFRNGACSAFPPYDFAREEACSFLEVPLAIMDTTLADHAPAGALAIATDVLAESRRWGAGGIAILWHDPLEAIGVPHEINDLFWTLLAARPSGERWVTAAQLADRERARFAAAGLPIRGSDHG